jgi:hypothetical protein
VKRLYSCTSLHREDVFQCMESISGASIERPEDRNCTEIAIRAAPLDKRMTTHGEEWESRNIQACDRLRSIKCLATGKTQK